MPINVEAHNGRLSAYKALALGHILSNDYYAAAQEVCRAAKIAVWKDEFAWCYTMSRELIEDHGVDWKKVVTALTP